MASFEVTEHQCLGAPGAPFRGVSGGIGKRRSAAQRECPVRAVIVVHAQADLLEVVGALSPSGRLAGGLDRRQQEGDQYGNYRNDNEQLDKVNPGRVCDFMLRSSQKTKR